MSGFRLHIGGQFDFEHPISYVGGAVVDDWDIEPDCLTMDTLNRAINIMGQKGSVLTIHYNRPGNSLGAGLSPVETDVDVHSLVTSWKEVGSIDVYVVHMLDDEIGDKQAGGCSRNNAEIDSGSEEENGSDFDEEWLDDVEYGSENENDELNEYLQKAKGFVDESATRGTGEGRSGETGEDDSDKDYSIGMDYEDDEELNWSLSDEDLPNELQELIKESGEVGNTRWRKSKKIYYNPERPNLQLHMIFSDPVQFREALIETSIESGYPFKYRMNSRKKIHAKCRGVDVGQSL
ncbi:hypothetical protein ACFE04_013916 [Oxalis oulophora]